MSWFKRIRDYWQRLQRIRRTIREAERSESMTLQELICEELLIRGIRYESTLIHWDQNKEGGIKILICSYAVNSDLQGPFPPSLPLL